MTETNQSPSEEPEYDRDGETGKFKPGNKGGPGRPKGSTGPSIKAALVRAIDNAPTREDGRTVLDGLAQVCLRQAMAGNFQYMSMLLDRLDGPVKQEIVTDSTIVIERVPGVRIDDEDLDDGV